MVMGCGMHRHLGVGDGEHVTGVLVRVDHRSLYQGESMLRLGFRGLSDCRRTSEQ